MLQNILRNIGHPTHRLLHSLDKDKGSQCLLNAAEYHIGYFVETARQYAEQYGNGYESIPYALMEVMHKVKLGDLSAAERAELIAKLRGYPPDTLKVLLAYAHDGTDILCEALEWTHALPLVTFIKETARHKHACDGPRKRDMPNSPDPAAGMLDVAQVRAALDAAGNEVAYDIFDVFRTSGETLTNTLLLVEAVTGRNRDEVETGLKKHSQIATKAYGLLPLERGEAEVLERYLALRQSAKESQRFGPTRRASHAGAVSAALGNLAQLAGYADADQLERAMEAKIAEDLAPPGRTWTIDDYTLELTVDGVDVSLTITRDGRTLKSVPKAVRANDAYQQARDAVQQLRGQISRMRNDLLENLIATGETMPRADFENVLKLPAAADLFQRLIWQTDGGARGLLDAAAMTLVDLDGARHPIQTGVGLVHSYDLFQSGTLAAWQREIVHQRIVQPIKQAFRELYVLTPAEQNTGTFSNRFAGHLIDGRIADRLFATRGWRMERGSFVRPYKVFGDIRAVFEMTHGRSLVTNDFPVTTDRICFEPYPVPGKRRRRIEDTNLLPLESIPPLVFSEVMRDADLIVSVAQRDGEGSLSAEAYAQRGSLVTTLLDDLGLPGVSVEGHFAFVQGKLAHYRVHLGSAVIHIEPGNYLCIVPDRWGTKHEKLFLPFADQSDRKISEVISKILLLLADDKIKDESILRQIRAQTQT